VAAADSVIGARARHVSAAVMAVVVFGTLGMYLLPVLRPVSWLERCVVRSCGWDSQCTSSVTSWPEPLRPGPMQRPVRWSRKMMRVMMLAPVVMLIAVRWRSGDTSGSRSPGVPLFLCGFIAMMALNASGLLPAWLHALGAEAAQALLAVGLAALGANTRMADMAQAGWRVWVLAALLWIWLLVAGLGLVRLGAPS
jgi:uncharacterized membrane protein YadS